ncbi:uncharacterized protein LY89DRAFT_788632 [Mollisia scopiformis]|uniref:Uncharacterized protein n=1 Tax=Mollisia scopiformis TaxID=149040 RepID=A0A132B8X7_MOLSC|nr:uncharacterized protein LY89DRAFT_788632 [Mollisia scopiformis]KUJ08703.1 hypothetical protein LY89DRAFT_788632 [Mollisia scopiformis]
MAAVQPQAPPSQCEIEIPWPLCAVTLLVLALNTMAQPAGRLCGHHRLRRTYLISSPLMCIYDLLFVLIYPLYICTRYSVNISTGITLLLSERFSAPVPEEKFHALAQRTWLRWLFFVLGPLPLTILLVGSKGILWTQVIGSIFFVDWLVGEVLIYLSTTPHFSSQEHENVPDMPDLMAYTGYTFVGFTILAWTWLLWTPFLRLESLQQNPFLSLAINLLFICVVPGCIAWALALGPEFLGLGRFLERHMTLSRWMCLAFPDYDGYYFLDTGAWHYAVVFLANVVFGVLAYALYYDPRGTEFPSWFKWMLKT